MGRVGRIGGVLAGVLVLVLALAQLLLPRIAASVVSSRVGRYGKVESVSVHAWPAVKMVWGSVDAIRVRAKSLTLSTAQAAKLLVEAHGVARMDLSAGSVRVGSLQLSDATLSKRGDALTARASASDTDVKAALPAGLEMQLLRSERGEVEVLAGGGLFGVGASVNAVAQASDGKLVVHPLGFLIGGLRLTLFADPHVYVEGVAASVQARQPLSYRVSMTARLR
jgi:hypothetical protein